MGRKFTNTGIEITNITGGTVIDGEGLVSTASFSTDLTDITDAEVSGTAWTSLADGTVSLVLSRDAFITLDFVARGTVPSGALVEVNVFDKNSITYNPALVFDTTYYKTQCISNMFSAGFSGTSTFEMKARFISGSGTALISHASVGVMNHGL